MKDNTFYKSEMDDGEWNVYIFNPSWTHEYFGKWGSEDNAGYINDYHHKDIFKRAVEIDGNEKHLSNLKQFAIKELFNGR